MSHRPIRTLAVLAVMPLVAGCDWGAPPTCSDGAMVEAIEAFVQAGPEGATMPLAEITDFEWDQMYGFSGLASSDQVEMVLGQELVRNSETNRAYSDGALLVFLRGAEILCQDMIYPPLWPYLNGAEEAYEPQDTILTVVSGDPGPYRAFELGRR